MFDNQENAKHRKKLKNCKTLNEVLFWASIAPTAISLIMSLILLFVPVYNIFYVILDGFVLNAAYFTMAYIGFYRRRSVYAAIAPVIPGFSIAAFINIESPLSLIRTSQFFIGVFVAIATVINNRVYTRLESLEGFPYFNERFEMQKSASEKFKYEDPFQAASDERKKTASDHMDDI